MNKSNNLSRLMVYAGGYRHLTYLSWMLASLSALITLVPFLYIWRIVELILSDSPSGESIILYGKYAMIFSLISIVVYISALMCSHISAFRVASNLRKELLYHISLLPIGTVEKYGSGSLRRTINTTTGATETYLAHRLPDKAVAVTTPIGLLVLLIAFDWRLGILSLIPVALGFFIMSKMTGRDMELKLKEYQNALSDMSKEAVEYIRGIPVVKTFGQTIFSFKRFKGSIDNYEKWVIAYTKALRLPMMLYTTAINAVFAFLIGGGIALTAKGVTNSFLLNLIFYVVITPVIGTSLTKIMFMSEDSMLVRDTINRIDTILKEKPLGDGNIKKPPLNSSVTFENISYSYDGSKKALDNVTIHIPSGQTIALVGASGGGKSTLASVAARFFDPQQGRVLIDGIDIKNMTKEALYSKISFVFQNSRLIKTSVRDNLLMAKPNATEEELFKALDRAQCRDIIEKLPYGIDTVIGTRGIYLSGGEQQRLAIARAILKNAPILILDEATAFADPDNEDKIQRAIGELSRNKTVIMIAHRLSSVVNTDCIYVMGEGKISEYGSHKELIEKDGVFSRMWKDYLKAVNWKITREDNYA